MRRAQVKLVEIGTTNRTHAKDYQEAIGPKTALLMKVHTSNYAVVGFTKVVEENAIADIAHAAGLPFVVDLGSGTLTDFAAFGLPPSPRPSRPWPPGPTSSPSRRQAAGRPAGRADRRAQGPDCQDQEEPAQARPARGQDHTGRAGSHAAAVPRPDRLCERLPTLRLLTRPVADICRTGRTPGPGRAGGRGRPCQRQRAAVQQPDRQWCLAH